LGIVCALLVSVGAAADSARDTISEVSVRTHLEFLASDAMNGRGSGTRDEWLAAEYIGAQLRLWGLEPLGDNGGYVQTIAIERTQLSGPPALTFGTGRFTHGGEIVVDRMSATRHSGTLVRFKEGAATAGAAVLIPEGTTPAQAAAVADAAIVMVPETPRARSQWAQVTSRPVSLGARLVAVPSSAPPRAARLTLDKAAYARIAGLPDGTAIMVEGQAAAPTRTQTWNAVGQLKGRDADRAAGDSAQRASRSSRQQSAAGRARLRPTPTPSTTELTTTRRGACGHGAGESDRDGKRPRRTIIFAFFGSEETGATGRATSPEVAGSARARSWQTCSSK
jgi:hypothetical protein